MTTPQNWQESIIGQLTECLDNRRIPVKESDRESEHAIYPYCGANGIQGFIDQYIFDEDLILIAEDGGNFHEWQTRPIAYKMSGKYWVNNHAHVLKAKNIDQDFLFYTLQHRDITQFIVGGTRTKLNRKVLDSIPISFPIDDKEQKAIAKALSDIDELITITIKEKEKFINLRMAAMQEVFTQQRFESKKFKVSGVIFGELINEINDGGTPNTQVDEYFGGDINWAVVEDVTAEIWTTTTKLTEKGLRNSSAILWPAGTLILTTGATIGKAGIAMVPMATKQGLCGIVVDQRKANTKYIKYWLEVNIDLLRSLSQGSTIKEVRPPVIKKIELQIPELEMQDEIVELLTDFDSEISQLQLSIEKYECIKQGMMNDLLTGKVRLV